jgi:hypothetical protein
VANWTRGRSLIQCYPYPRKDVRLEVGRRSLLWSASQVGAGVSRRLQGLGGVSAGQAWNERGLQETRAVDPAISRTEVWPERRAAMNDASGVGRIIVSTTSRKRWEASERKAENLVAGAAPRLHHRGLALAASWKQSGRTRE